MLETGGSKLWTAGIENPVSNRESNWHIVCFPQVMLSCTMAGMTRWRGAFSQDCGLAKGGGGRAKGAQAENMCD